MRETRASRRREGRASPTEPIKARIVRSEPVAEPAALHVDDPELLRPCADRRRERMLNPLPEHLDLLDLRRHAAEGYDARRPFPPSCEHAAEARIGSRDGLVL